MELVLQPPVPAVSKYYGIILVTWQLSAWPMGFAYDTKKEHLNPLRWNKISIDTL